MITDNKNIKKEENSTKRDISEGVESILDHKIDVLDKGFVRVVDYMGNDSAIVQAARVSYGKGTKTINKDRGLIRYLLRNKHTTPFEMCEIKLHIKLPIFVARQWIRHRTANINEYSARYSVLEDEFYIPNKDNVSFQSANNFQGREDEAMLDKDANEIIDTISNFSEQSYDIYQNMIDKGLARELARVALPVNIYTQFYWKIDLHNLLHFIKLRADQHAQYEIRVYAEAIEDILKCWVPIVYEAYVDYIKDAVNISKPMFDIIKKIIKKEDYSDIKNALSNREIIEMSKIFNIDL